MGVSTVKNKIINLTTACKSIKSTFLKVWGRSELPGSKERQSIKCQTWKSSTSFWHVWSQWENRMRESGKNMKKINRGKKEYDLLEDFKISSRSIESKVRWQLKSSKKYFNSILSTQKKLTTMGEDKNRIRKQRKSYQRTKGYFPAAYHKGRQTATGQMLNFAPVSKCSTWCKRCYFYRSDTISFLFELRKWYPGYKYVC